MQLNILKMQSKTNSFNNLMKVGLLGEKLQIYTDMGSQKVQWSKFGDSTTRLLTWYKVWEILFLHALRLIYIICIMCLGQKFLLLLKGHPVHSDFLKSTRMWVPIALSFWCNLEPHQTIG